MHGCSDPAAVCRPMLGKISPCALPYHIPPVSAESVLIDNLEFTTTGLNYVCVYSPTIAQPPGLQ
ncbi:hypothetical protein TNCT_194291, partial [Trichonephila clavata]